MTELEELQEQLNDIREALQRLTPGSRAHQKLSEEQAALEGQLAGSGAVAPGDGATAIGEDGIGVGGNLHGTLIKGEQNQVFRNSTVILAGDGARILVGEHSTEHNSKPNAQSATSYALTSTSILTFLFTDIEGSTQLWENHPEAMKLALARHDAILRGAIESHKGKVFKTLGDAFYSVFPNARNALKAALAAQRALHAEAWGETVIKVRMALHTGAVEARDGDYFGQPLNRVARLMSAGHGGQVLLSTAFAELVRPNLPPDAELRDMGERRLKDLARAEHIYQLLAPGLPADFPALKTLETIRTNLPAQLTSFIGREKEIAAVKQLLAPISRRDVSTGDGPGVMRAGEGARLVTLTGSGGAGKTRLSLQVAADLLDSFPGGIWFIELAPLSDPALIPQTVAAALGLHDESGRPLLDMLTDYLRAKTTLLVLDNCEHVIAAAAQFAENMLQGCPNLRLLVSSREALGISGEAAYRVPSLSIPNPRIAQPVADLATLESVRLFVERAQAVSAGFALSQDNAHAIAQVCARLDGIPLAIELAAARVKLLKVEQIAERLDDRFRLLTGGSRTALPRQQTLRAMIDWSYDLLSEPERALLRRLSVFSGGWTLEAAETVCQGPSIDDYNVLDPLAQLVNKSLVVVDADEGVETRYRLLETVRQYAREKLIEASEGMAVRDLHLQYFLGLAERAEPELIGSNMPEWLNRLEVEHDNFRAALEWSLKQNPQVGLQLAGTLYWFWQQMMYHDEGIEWLKKLLATEGSQFIHLAIKAKALNAAGWLIAALMAKVGIQDDAKLALALALSNESLALFKQLGDKQGMAFALRSLLTVYGYSQAPNYEVCHALANESLALFRELGNKYGIAEMTGFLAGLALLQGNLDQAEALYDEALLIKKELRNLGDVAWDLSMLARVAAHRGNHERTKALFEESYSIYRELGTKNKRYKWWAINPANCLAECMLLESAYERAVALAEESLALCREIGSAEDSDSFWPLLLLGNALLGLGNYQQATELLEEGLGLCQTMGYQRGIADVLQTLAGVAAAQNQPERAARLFGAADAIFETIQVQPVPYQRVQRERDIAIISAQLDEAAFAAAQAKGRAMSMDEAIALALESTHD
jgi:predicted ATPase/class 3 adenylate cyclase